MSKNYGVVAIHGVGPGTEMDRKGFSMELKKRVYPDLKDAEINWHEYVWEGRNEEIDSCVGGVVRRLLKDYHLVKKSDAEGWYQKLWRGVANFAIDMCGGIVSDGLDLGLDFVLYLDSDHGQKIRDGLKEEILSCAEKHPDGIVLVAHSLGSVVAYDTIAEAQLEGSPLPVKWLITFGSPLAWTFDLRKAEGKKELAYTSIGGVKWKNFYYVEDCVCLHEHLPNEQFQNVENVPLKLPKGSARIASHCAYWADDAFAEHIRNCLDD